MLQEVSVAPRPVLLQLVIVRLLLVCWRVVACPQGTPLLLLLSRLVQMLAAPLQIQRFHRLYLPPLPLLVFHNVVSLGNGGTLSRHLQSGEVGC